MDRKKAYKEKRRHSIKKQTTAKARKESDSLKFLHDMQSQGLVKIFLSPLTQKILECRIGENITAECRWVFIKKEKIEDNIFLHDTSSEFLPLKAKVEKYPEPLMLIGSFSYIQDIATDFYLCTTTQVKEQVVSNIEKEKKYNYERMWNLIHPTPNQWKDLGSQIEVDANMPKKNRSLFEIVLSSEYPIPYHYTHFKMCLVEDMPNSYVATGSGRFAYNLIFRKCVDVSTQSTLPTKDKSLQSILSVSRNKRVQYSYHCEKLEMTEEFLEVIKKFFKNKCSILYQTLLVNFNINLFCDDYQELAINYKGLSFKDPIELRSYQEVMNCKHMKVSCISWHALISGLVAVAYSITPIYYIGKHQPIHNDADDTVFEKHLVLLWAYTDNVRPKLYIHAYREVTALSFCPYDKNILVGGYSNGQIVVWDITNRINAVETREVLTNMEHHHRAFVTNETSWIKPGFGVQHVFPTLTSLFTNSHLSAVTSIIWIPPSHYISSMGKYEACPPDEDHMQFFSTGLSGHSIQVWDLKLQKQQLEKKTWKKRTQRLSKQPEALAQTESPLKKLQNVFIPHYRLFVTDLVKGIPIPLTNIVTKNQAYVYEPINPETLKDIEKRTYFRLRGSKQSFDETHQLMLSSALGTLAIVKWEGSAYNQGLRINSEPCSLTYLANVHDGPIVTCELNQFLPNVLLTTGGSVFAIWEYAMLNVPLVWRKSNVRYISGMWSFRHPLTLFLTRSDSYFEIWNLLENSEGPVRFYKFKGNQLTSLFNDPNRIHVRKETFITSDIVGAIKVFTLPSGVISFKNSNKDESIDYIKHVISIKKYTEQLKMKHRKEQENAALTMTLDKETQATPLQETAEPKVIKLVPQKREEKVVDTAINKWQKRLENHMHNILLEKKRLNVKDIERNWIPMQKLMDQENKKQKKINDKIMSREEDFKKITGTLITPIERQKIRRKITVKLPKEMTSILKQKYYENFKKIEVETIQKIKSNSFVPDFDWNNMIQFGINPKRNSKL